jgi:hypothetical protein
MATVPVSTLRPGVRLARSIHVADGRILVRAGEPLTDHQVALLQLWGVPYVHVAPEADPPAGDAAAVAGELAHAFRRVPQPLDPVMEAIYEAALRCRARRRAQGKKS